MSVLSDSDIARAVHYGDLEIDPYDESNIQPASYDVTLGNEWIVPERQDRSDDPVTLGDGLSEMAQTEITSDSIVLEPFRSQGDVWDGAPFVLGHIEETISIPPHLTAEVRGRSSIGRLGIIPHTAGWCDPGFEGDITLEFVNVSPNPVELESGTRIAQIVFTETTSAASTPYGEKSDQKYQGQSGVTESRIDEDE